MKYRITVTRDKVRGEWVIKLAKKWWWFWIPEIWIWTDQYYEHNSDFKRWKSELNPHIIIKKE